MAKNTHHPPREFRPPQGSTPSPGYVRRSDDTTATRKRATTLLHLHAASPLAKETRQEEARHKDRVGRSHLDARAPMGSTRRAVDHGVVVASSKTNDDQSPSTRDEVAELISTTSAASAFRTLAVVLERTPSNSPGRPTCSFIPGGPHPATKRAGVRASYWRSGPPRSPLEPTFLTLDETQDECSLGTADPLTPHVRVPDTQEDPDIGFTLKALLPPARTSVKPTRRTLFAFSRVPYVADSTHSYELNRRASPPAQSSPSHLWADLQPR
jgi:hypothetical protein